MSANRQGARTPAAPRSRRSLVIGFALIVVVALALGGVRFALALGPVGTAQRYCDAMTRRDYPAVYRLLASGPRAQVDEATFVAGETLADQQAGVVTGCDVSPLSVDVGWSAAVAHVTVRRASGVAVAVPLRVAGSGWLIDELPDPALLPFALARQWCDAVASQSYVVAYHLLSSAITAAVPQDRFTALSEQADQSSGKVTSCQIATLALGASGQAATAQAVVRRQQGASATVRLALGRQAGAWVLTSLPAL